MLYLSEREVGWDPELIGFPSIGGCHAIVYVTSGGLFGFHNYGGSANNTWQDRAEAFANFVRSHDYNATGSRLYGVAFVLEKRGYSPPQVENWKGELKTFAAALGFTGKIRGFDLSSTDISGSAYVEYRKTNDKCAIFVSPWQTVLSSTGANVNGPDHKIIITQGGIHTTLGDQTAQVVDYAQALTLDRVHTTRLTLM
ncbi:MAG: hypothetical protein QOF70_624 [Acetobacteraceae bacterium]|nr:hypothetical protein [Acetobacteraceae bacterium]